MQHTTCQSHKRSTGPRTGLRTTSCLLIALAAIAAADHVYRQSTPSLVQVPSPPQGPLYSATALTATDMWAGGWNEFIDPNTGAIDFQPIAEHFDGNSWSLVSTPLVATGGVGPPDARWFGISAAASNDVWAVGFRFGPNNPDNGETLIEHWDGQSWSVVTSPTSKTENTSLAGVAAVASNDVWAVGGSGGSALVEHWDGSHWNLVNVSGGPLGAIAADGSDDVWAGGGGASGFLHFDGKKWSSVASAIGARAIAPLSPTNAWAAGSVGVFIQTKHGRREVPSVSVEHWDGTSWSSVTMPSPGTPSFLNAIAAISPTNIWAVGEFGSQTVTEHWDGTAWSIISSPDPGPLLGASALSDGTVVAVGGTNSGAGFILQNPASAPKPPPVARQR